MASTLTQNPYLVPALVSALLILAAARRAAKKPSLLTDIRNVDTGDVTSRQLFGSEYDIIIVGGGEFPPSRRSYS